MSWVSETTNWGEAAEFDGRMESRKSGIQTEVFNFLWQDYFLFNSPPKRLLQYNL